LLRRQFAVVRGRHPEPQVRAPERVDGTLHPQPLDPVPGFPHARGIDQPDRKPVHVYDLFDRVSCRAGDFGHDGPFISREPV
jgi:hypothetical protein